jgi:hypothetical protein
MKTDLQRYYDAMKSGYSEECYRIEKKYHLDGYPPELVTVGLLAIQHNLCPDVAIEDYIANVEA